MSEIIFYGERGIVNGFVLDVSENIEKMKDILRHIHWVKKTDTSWIDDVDKIQYIVEPGFGQFGQPDLIVICDLINKNKYFLIIEAKADTYKASSNELKDMRKSGFNSSINGQLALNYRFVKALELYFSDNYKEKWVIREPEEIFNIYKEKYHDKCNMPRHTAKDLTREKIVKQYLSEMRLENTYFIVLSNDNKEEVVHPMSPSPDIYDGYTSIWESISDRFGMLYINAIKKDVLAGGRFAKQVELHIGKQQISVEDNKSQSEIFCFKRISSPLSDKADKIAEDICLRIPEVKKTKKNCKSGYTFSLSNKAVCKLCYGNTKDKEGVLMLGFAAQYANKVQEALERFENIGQPKLYSLGTHKSQFFLFDITDLQEEIAKAASYMLENAID